MKEGWIGLLARLLSKGEKPSANLAASFWGGCSTWTAAIEAQGVLAVGSPGRVG